MTSNATLKEVSKLGFFKKAKVLLRSLREYKKESILHCLETSPSRMQINDFGTGNASKLIVELL